MVSISRCEVRSPISNAKIIRDSGSVIPCFAIVYLRTFRGFVSSSRTRPHLNLMEATRTRMASQRHTSRRQHLIMQHVSAQSIHNRMTFFPPSSARKAPGACGVFSCSVAISWDYFLMSTVWPVSRDLARLGICGGNGISSNIILYLLLISTFYYFLKS